MRAVLLITLLLLAGCAKTPPQSAAVAGLMGQGLAAYWDGDDKGVGEAMGKLEALATDRHAAANAAAELGALRAVLLLHFAPATRFAYAARLCSPQTWATPVYEKSDDPAPCPGAAVLLLRWRLALLLTQPLDIIRGNNALDEIGLLMPSPHRQAGFASGEVVHLSPLTPR